MTEDTYKSIAGEARAELKIKGSRFIAEAFEVTTAEEAEEHILQIKKREYGATHHCTAWRVGEDGARSRFNDDGEPSGTAGKPILQQIDARELTNTLVVVTRYFGGTKLGTGGLIRAYGDSAAAVLDCCTITAHIRRTHLEVQFPYDFTSQAMHTIGRYDVEIIGSFYEYDTRLRLAIRNSEVASFQEAFIEALSGRGRVL